MSGCRRCGVPVEPEWSVESGGLCGDCLADDALLPLSRILGEPPDITGPGEITCTCGYFKIGPVRGTPGLSVVTQCPHCGRVVEPWSEQP